MPASTPKADKPKRKAPKTAWKPGQSGNPGGRKPTHPELRALLLEHAPEAIRRLAYIVQYGSEKESRMAAEGIIDRAGLKGFSIEPDNHAFVGADGKPLEQFVVKFVRPGDDEGKK